LSSRNDAGLARIPWRRGDPLTAVADGALPDASTPRRRRTSAAGAACRQNRAIHRCRVDDPAAPSHRHGIRGACGLALRDSAMLTFILWCLLFVFCWPLALLALVLYPIVWLLSLPFRLVGISVSAVFALLTALLFLPARALGQRR
jgi:hypothetical protein